MLHELLRLAMGKGPSRQDYHSIIAGVRRGSQSYDRMLWPAAFGTYRRSKHGGLGGAR